MLDTVWRVSEKGFNVDDFLAKFNLQDKSAVFHQGEKGHRGQIHDKSGFNILVSGKEGQEKRVSSLL